MLPKIGLEEVSDGWWMALSAVGVVLATSFVIIGIYAFMMRKRDRLTARLSIAQDLLEPKSQQLSSSLESPMMNDLLSRRPSLVRQLQLYDRVVTDVIEQDKHKQHPAVAIAIASAIASTKAAPLDNSLSEVTETSF